MINIAQWMLIVGMQTVVSLAVGVVLYRRLRLKLGRQIREYLEKPVQVQTICQQTPEVNQARTNPGASTQMASALFGPDVLRLRFVLNTLPKIGSNSIREALKHALPESTLRCFHGITLETQRALSEVIEQADNEWGRQTTYTHVFGMMGVRAELERRWNDAPKDTGLYFICGAREPVSWALSTLFQLQDVGILPASVLQPEEARRLIMEWMHGRPPCAFFPRPEDWFQLEVSDYLGVNPMEIGFDTARGFQIYPTRKGPLLIIRNESLRCLPGALSELLAVPQGVFQYEPPRANVTERKTQGQLYREVAATLRFPASFIDELYTRPYSTTFYSADERKVLTERWSEKCAVQDETKTKAI